MINLERKSKVSFYILSEISLKQSLRQSLFVGLRKKEEENEGKMKFFFKKVNLDIPSALKGISKKAFLLH